MKEEITSDEYWKLPDIVKSNYQQISLQHNGYEWVPRTLYGHQLVEIKTVYRLKKIGNQTYNQTF